MCFHFFIRMIYCCGRLKIFHRPVIIESCHICQITFQAEVSFCRLRSHFEDILVNRGDIPHSFVESESAVSVLRQNAMPDGHRLDRKGNSAQIIFKAERTQNPGGVCSRAGPGAGRVVTEQASTDLRKFHNRVTHRDPPL